MPLQKAYKKPTKLYERTTQTIFRIKLYRVVVSSACFTAECAMVKAITVANGRWCRWPRYVLGGDGLCTSIIEQPKLARGAGYTAKKPSVSRDSELFLSFLQSLRNLHRTPSER